MTFRNRLLTISCLALAGLPFAQAADIDVFGGYSVTRMRPEDKSNNTTMNGWNTTVTAYATWDSPPTTRALTAPRPLP